MLNNIKIGTDRRNRLWKWLPVARHRAGHHHIKARNTLASSCCGCQAEEHRLCSKGATKSSTITSVEVLGDHGMKGSNVKL